MNSIKAAPRYLSMKEEDYKTYVLYVIPGDKSSQLAQELASQSNEIQIVNIMMIKQMQLPKWLNGAPTLQNIQTNDVFKGSKALQQLKSLSMNTLQPVENRIGIGYDFDTFQSTSKTCSSGTKIVPMLDDEKLYSNNKPKPTESDINRIIDARNNTFKSAQ